VGDGGTTGSIAGNVVNNGALTFSRSDATSFTGVISGSGSLTKAGAGTLTLSADQTYTGGTTIAGGTLQIGAGGTTGAIGGNVANSGTLAFNRSDAATFAGVVSGTGALTKSGAGTLTLTSANTYTGGTTINAGTLQIGAGGTTGAVTGNVVNNGALAFNRSDAVTFGGVISGTGAVTKAGASTLTLTGVNTYTGTTTISAGTLQIGNGGTTGAIAGNVVNNGTLAFNRSDAVTFAGVISGSGGLTKAGADSLTLTGTSTYTGATTVNGGKLVVNGSIAASAVTLNNGATLGGSGQVGALTVGSGATLSAGNSIGVLNINGALTFAAGSSLVVELSPTDADRVNATGTASLNGSVTANYGTGSYVAKKYTIVHADGGVSGTFAGGLTNANLPTGFKSNLTYDANNAYVNLELLLATYTGLDTNQQGVADSLKDFFDSTGGIDAKYAQLTTAQLTEADGEAGAANIGASFDGVDQFMGALIGRRAAGSEAGDGAWSSYLDDSSTIDADTAVGSRETKVKSRQLVLGADKVLSDHTVVGIALSQGEGEFSLAGAGGGRGEGDLTFVGFHGRTGHGPYYLKAAIAYGQQKSTIDRTVSISGTDALRSEAKTRAAAWELEGGMRIENAAVNLTPYLAIRLTSLDTGPYAETARSGTTAYAVSYQANEANATRIEVGARADRRIALADGAALTLSGRAALASDDAERTAEAGLTALPGSTFVVRGAEPGKDAKILAAAARYDFANGLSLAAGAEGRWSDGRDLVSATLTARYAW
jgi:autotransporter-associated beta strand protein